MVHNYSFGSLQNCRRIFSLFPSPFTLSGYELRLVVAHGRGLLNGGLNGTLGVAVAPSKGVRTNHFVVCKTCLSEGHRKQQTGPGPPPCAPGRGPAVR